jgi:hypothetical protein
VDGVALVVLAHLVCIQFDLLSALALAWSRIRPGAFKDPLLDLLEYVIIAASSFAIILVLYEFAVRRVNVLRFVFGMKPLLRTNAAVMTSGQISVKE